MAVAAGGTGRGCAGEHNLGVRLVKRLSERRQTLVNKGDHETIGASASFEHRRSRAPGFEPGAESKSAGYAFVGSSPTSPTLLKSQQYFNCRLPLSAVFHVAWCCKIFSFYFNGSHRLRVTPRDTLAT